MRQTDDRVRNRRTRKKRGDGGREDTVLFTHKSPVGGVQLLGESQRDCRSTAERTTAETPLLTLDLPNWVKRFETRKEAQITKSLNTSRLHTLSNFLVHKDL